MTCDKFDDVCPVFLTLSLIANKWAVLIIHTLSKADDNTLRFGTLQKNIPNITKAELTKQLKEFEKCGIVARKQYPEIPPRVEYTLTEMGLSLGEPIKAMSKWAKKYGDAVKEALKEKP